MVDVATLYVRNIPAALYDELQRWAGEHDRSINAEVVDLLRRESERRREDNEVSQSLVAYFEKYCDQPVKTSVVELIREDRERGHKPELGY